MTPQQHVTRCRQVAFQLERADYGMGMPRDYQLVCRLKVHFEQCAQEAVIAIHDAFRHGSLPLLDAVAMLTDIGEEEAKRVVDEWAQCAEIEEGAS